MPPELLRKGRFDEIFFVDMPTEQERADIFQIHLEKKGRDPANFDLDELARIAKGFSGAEIEQAVVGAMYNAFFEDEDIDTARVKVACNEVIPLGTTMKEKIDELREWAAVRARSASGMPIGAEGDGDAGEESEQGTVPAGFRNLELGDD